MSQQSPLTTTMLIEKLSTMPPNTPVLVFAAGSVYQVQEVQPLPSDDGKSLTAELGCGWVELDTEDEAA